jgi:hypothetical protein
MARITGIAKHCLNFDTMTARPEAGHIIEMPITLIKF